MIVILDGNSIVYRAFHKAPPLTAQDGTPTGAIHVFFTILERVKREIAPSKILAVFDSKGETHRHVLFPEYKANREAMPEDLAKQLSLLKTILPLTGIPLYAKAGVEADDIIFTLARLHEREGVVLVTKDKDLFQLVNEHIKVYDDRDGALLGEEETVKKYGVAPTQILDYLSLMGDASDNIPGVAGVGEKTAQKLINEYGSLDKVYENLNSQKGKLRENLEKDKAAAYLSRELIALKEVSPMFQPEAGENADLLRETLTRLSMRNILSRIMSGDGADAPPAFQLPKTLPPCRLGEVLRPAFFIFIDGEAVVTDGERYESFKEHAVDENVKFWNVKEFYKLTGRKYFNISDYYLKGWLIEPDNGALYKAKNESFEEFIPKLLHTADYLDRRLAELKLESLYHDVELPTAYILGDMERAGIALSPDVVAKVKILLKQKLNVTASLIFNYCGLEFNLNSPKQLAELLYGKLQIPPIAKTNKSTAEDVLKELMNNAPEHAGLLTDILTYREYAKLLSTYTDPLIEAVGEDGRLHTTFKQTGTATGRLSSAAPNLQNIPVRDEVGKSIRGAFVAPKGRLLVSLDYSQIELRVLAHVSKDPELTEAFRKDLDVHTITASKVFNIPQGEVDAGRRRLAKAVNFGILYGLSAFGLARDTGITPKEAKRFIDAYFELYKGVRFYISELIGLTRERGYCETILGRKRFFPDIDSRNGVIRQRAERAAMNAPIQGSAADIIKLAMIKCDKALEEKRYVAKMCLQIHDELLFEAEESAANEFAGEMKSLMEGAVTLNVPLSVNVNLGKTWGDLK